MLDGRPKWRAGRTSHRGAEIALSDDDTLVAQAHEVLYGIDHRLGLVLATHRPAAAPDRRADPPTQLWGFWLGIGIASLSGLMTVLVMFAFPLWAIAVLTIDFLVLFALLTESKGFTA